MRGFPVGAPSGYSWNQVKIALAQLLGTLKETVWGPPDWPAYNDDVQARFNGTFQFVRDREGKIGSVRYADDEDPEIVNFKKGAAESFQNLLVYHGTPSIMEEVGTSGTRKAIYSAVSENDKIAIASRFDENTGVAERDEKRFKPAVRFSATTLAWLDGSGSVRCRCLGPISCYHISASHLNCLLRPFVRLLKLKLRPALQSRATKTAEPLPACSFLTCPRPLLSSSFRGLLCKSFLGSRSVAEAKPCSTHLFRRHRQQSA